MRRKNILGTSISTGSYPDFINEIIRLARERVPSYVCFANVHMVIEAHRNKEFQQIINRASLTAPDGKPLSVFLRIFYGLKQDRVCGMDVMPEILGQAADKGMSVFLYGTTPELLHAIIQKAKLELPGLVIAGSYAPPFRDLTNQEDAEIVEMINQAKPDLVLVSLGCPKQEKWVAEHKHRITGCLLALGQAFKVYAGVEKRLPRWMRELSLEWAYRLYLEPSRLWKRYLYANSYFLLLTSRLLLARLFNKKLLFSGKTDLEQANK